MAANFYVPTIIENCIINVYSARGDIREIHITSEKGGSTDGFKDVLGWFKDGKRTAS